MKSLKVIGSIENVKSDKKNISKFSSSSIKQNILKVLYSIVSTDLFHSGAQWKFKIK